MHLGTWLQAHAYDPSDYMETRLKALRYNCRMQSIKRDCSKLDINNNFFLGEISHELYLIESKCLIAGNQCL